MRMRTMNEKRRQAGRTPNASRHTQRSPARQRHGLRQPSATFPHLILILGLLAGLGSPALCETVKSDERVLFLSGMGREQTDGWNLEIHGWIYESEYHKPLTSLFRRAIGIRDDELTPLEQSTFRERAQFFLVDNERS